MRKGARLPRVESRCGSKGPFRVAINLNSCLGRPTLGVWSRGQVIRLSVEQVETRLIKISKSQRWVDSRIS